MYRQDRHARKGNEMMAISAVDYALWDLRGKALRPAGLPPARRPDPREDRLLRLDARPLAGARPRRASAPSWAVEQGFKAQKWFFRYGPIHGLEGMAKNVELVRTVREAVGPNIEIMFDCWMGWDRTYTIRLAERIEEYHPRWIEESVPPDRTGDFAAIRESTPHPDRHRRARVHPLGLPEAAPGRRDRRDPGRPRLVRRHHRAGQDLHARLGVRARRDPARPLDPRRRPRHRRAVAVRLPDGRDAAAGAPPASSTSTPRR